MSDTNNGPHLEHEQPTPYRASSGFFSTLFSGQHEGFAKLMFLHPSEERPFHVSIPLDDDNRIEHFAEHVGRYVYTHDCYVGPAIYAQDFVINEETNRRQYRTKEMVTACRWAFGERDDHTLSDLLSPPTLTVETSAGRYQDYWRLDVGADVPTVEDLNRRIARACGYGNQAIDASRVLRIVGTQNLNKVRNREVVRIVRQTGAIYTLDDFHHLPPVPESRPSRLSYDDGPAWVVEPLTKQDEALIERALRTKSFARLWEGDFSDYKDEDGRPDQSRADFALCCSLARRTGCDEEWMDRIFRHSGLYRDKWERDDYRERTISKAIGCVD